MKNEFSSEEQAKKIKVEQDQVDRNTEVSSDEIKVDQDKVGRKNEFVNEEQVRMALGKIKIEKGQVGKKTSLLVKNKLEWYLKR